MKNVVFRLLYKERFVDFTTAKWLDLCLVLVLQIQRRGVAFIQQAVYTIIQRRCVVPCYYNLFSPQMIEFFNNYYFGKNSCKFSTN
jgi:hypothetical protein